MTAFFGSIPAMIVLTGVLVGLASVLPGTFLVLRGNAMLTDAISHSIVLGIVLVWLATGATAGPVQIAGAALAGIVTVVATEALARTRLVKPDAAIGLVFPAMFALGVLLINVFARNVHLDAHTVLLGEIGFVWLDTLPVMGAQVPRAVVWLAIMLAINAGFVLAFYKELKLATFDADQAEALGLRPRLLFNLLLALTSATAVAAFDAVGVILFITFVIVPPATALLLTDRLSRMIALAGLVAAGSALSGYPLAVMWDVSIGGMMALMTGAFFTAAFLLAPRHGLVAGWLRARGQRRDHDCRALVVHLLNHADTPEAAEENTARAMAEHLHWAAPRVVRVIVDGLDRGLIRREGEMLTLTPKGRAMARDIRDPLAG